MGAGIKEHQGGRKSLGPLHPKNPLREKPHLGANHIGGDEGATKVRLFRNKGPRAKKKRDLRRVKEVSLCLQLKTPRESAVRWKKTTRQHDPGNDGGGKQQAGRKRRGRLKNRIFLNK